MTFYVKFQNFQGPIMFSRSFRFWKMGIFVKTFEEVWLLWGKISQTIRITIRPRLYVEGGKRHIGKRIGRASCVQA